MKKTWGCNPYKVFLGEIFEKKSEKARFFEPDLGRQNVSRITKMPTSPVANLPRSLVDGCQCAYTTKVK
jgi:hypothetical protein